MSITNSNIFTVTVSRMDSGHAQALRGNLTGQTSELGEELSSRKARHLSESKHMDMLKLFTT